MPRKLTFLQTEDLYSAALSNAFGLHQDAWLLLESGSLGRARALAVLGLEECGKAVLIQRAKVRSFAAGIKDPVLDDVFWHAWINHREKLQAVRHFLIEEDYWFNVAPPPINDLLLGEVEELATDLHEFAARNDMQKQAGLYVQVDHATGRAISPDDFIDRDEVVELLDAVHQVGWQLRLGDHIEFVAKPRDAGTLDMSSSYSAYADGGSLAKSRGQRGWEAHNIELLRLAGAFTGDGDQLSDVD